MKNKLLVNVGLSLLIALFMVSCFDTGIDQPELEHTEEVELQLLKKYIDSLDVRYDVDTTDMGVYYVIIEEGEGDYPNAGDTLTVGYSGYLINGFMFDSSDIYYSDGKWEFILGDSTLVPGFNDGMKNINKGGLIQLVIPSDLAFGSTGSANVGPYETLVFVVELFDLKPSE